MPAQKSNKRNHKDFIDRNLLHQFLWDTRDRSNFMSYKTGELAEMLGSNVYTMSRILAELTNAGKLKKYGNSKYQVIEPGIAAWHTDTEGQE